VSTWFAHNGYIAAHLGGTGKCSHACHRVAVAIVAVCSAATDQIHLKTFSGKQLAWRHHVVDQSHRRHVRRRLCFELPRVCSLISCAPSAHCIPSHPPDLHLAPRRGSENSAATSRTKRFFAGDICAEPAAVVGCPCLARGVNLRCGAVGWLARRPVGDARRCVRALCADVLRQGSAASRTRRPWQLLCARQGGVLRDVRWRVVLTCAAVRRSCARVHAHVHCRLFGWTCATLLQLPRF
jgi:hypothetical protein